VTPITARARRLMAVLTGVNLPSFRRSRKWIANLTQQSERSLKRSIAECVGRGWIEAFPGGSGQPGIINVLNRKAWVLAPVARECEILAPERPILAPETPWYIAKTKDKERKPVSFERLTERERRAIARATPIGGRREPIPLSWEEQREVEQILRASA
jgi:hypothetical protein